MATWSAPGVSASPAAVPAPAAYQDQYLTQEELQVLDAPQAASGPYRHWSLETGGWRQTGAGTELRGRAQYDWQTSGWGDWQMQGWWRRLSQPNQQVSRDAGGALSVAHLPVTSEWQGAMTLGDALWWQDLSAASGVVSRFYLPIQSVRGLSARLQNQHGSSFSLITGQALGALATLDGTSSASYRGRIASVGGGWKTASGLWHLQWLQEHGGTADEAPDHSSLYGSWASGAGPWNWQANVLHTRTVHSSPRTGGWLDVQRKGDYRFSGSVFALQPDLHWGDTALSQNLQGGSARVERSTRQWAWGVSADWVKAYDAHATAALPSTLYQQAYGRYWVSPTQQWSAMEMVRTGSGKGQQAQLAWSTRNDLGHAQVQLDGQWQPDSRTRRLSLSQDLYQAQGRSLRALGSRTWGVSQQVRQTASEWGIAGSWDMTGQWSLNGQLRAYRQNNGAGNVQRGWEAQIGSSLQFAPGWSMQVALNRQNTHSLFTDLTSPLSQTTTQASTTATLTLRYEGSAGRQQSAPWGGTGDVTIDVFRDENHNGERDLNETGVLNALVLIDGRQMARTDATGHVTVRGLSAGVHEFTLLPDQIPLPWTAPQPTLRLRVELRGNTAVTFPLSAM